MKEKLPLIIAVIFLIVSVVFFLHIRTDNKAAELTEKKQSLTEQIDNVSSKARDRVLGIYELDIIEGDEDAEITIIEYASLKCSHCAGFHKNTYPYLKENYIDKGKVKFIFRHYPFDEADLKATQLVYCTPSNLRGDVINVLFETQNSWAFTKQFPERLENIAKISGMSGEIFHQCMANETLEGEIIKMRFDAIQGYKVNSTPTLIINGQKYIGPKDKNSLEKYLNNL